MHGATPRRCCDTHIRVMQLLRIASAIVEGHSLIAPFSNLVSCSSGTAAYGES